MNLSRRLNNKNNHHTTTNHNDDVPETPTPNSNVPSTMKTRAVTHHRRGHGRRKRPETARAVLMGRNNSNIKKMIFHGHVRNSGFDSPLKNHHTTGRKPYKPRMVQSARYRHSPRKKNLHEGVDQSVQTSRYEDEDEKKKSNGGKKNNNNIDGNRARRERNIQSAGRAYERRRKKGSLSPRRERRLRPQSAKATIHSRKKKKAPFYTTVKDRSSFSPV